MKSEDHGKHEDTTIRVGRILLLVWLIEWTV